MHHSSHNLLLRDLRVHRLVIKKKKKEDKTSRINLSYYPINIRQPINRKSFDHIDQDRDRSRRRRGGLTRTFSINVFVVRETRQRYHRERRYVLRVWLYVRLRGKKVHKLSCPEIGIVRCEKRDGSGGKAPRDLTATVSTTIYVGVRVSEKATRCLGHRVRGRFPSWNYVAIAAPFRYKRRIV